MRIQPSDLQKLTADPSADVRVDVTEKIASGFKNGEFTISEKKIATEIFRLLVNDIEKRVRIALSKQLADSMDAPHDVVLKLANDVKEVALPVLQHSFVLTEGDLIDITHHSQDTEVMSAIARRDIVSRELSAALLKKSDMTVVETLLSNKNASIDDRGLNEIYTGYSSNISMLELMAKRGGIPATLAEKLFVVVSDEVKKILTRQYNISFQVASDSAQYARELATLGLIDDSMQKMEMEDLVSHLDKNGRLSFSLIIRSLCLGNIRFFEYAMAKLAGISNMNARILILDRENGFEKLYEKTGLPPEMFKAIRYLLTIALEETALGRYHRNDFRQRLASRISKDSNATKIEYMDYIVLLIQNNMVDNG
ncbi:MAG TPA: DUF2336 domain-containing protein [Rickettsiales bacterium]|nr:DUF2336 domain-containing protein [Rickettsiales bacterium]